jgi:hypothetical protein
MPQTSRSRRSRVAAAAGGCRSRDSRSSGDASDAVVPKIRAGGAQNAALRILRPAVVALFYKFDFLIGVTLGAVWPRTRFFRLVMTDLRERR